MFDIAREKKQARIIEAKKEQDDAKKRTLFYNYRQMKLSHNIKHTR